MKAHALILVLALALPFSICAQQAPRKSPEQGKSQKPLAEGELAEIAGGSGGVQFMLHIIDNPGKANVEQKPGHMKNGHIHCVGACPLGSGTSAVHIIFNPAQTVDKCVGGGC